MVCELPNPLRLTHAAHVHFFLLPADEGVLEQKALSLLLKRRLRSISYPPPAPPAEANNRGLEPPGIDIMLNQTPETAAIKLPTIAVGAAA